VASIQRTRKRASRTKPISEKLRAEDNELREKLQDFDVQKFGDLLKKAVKPVKAKSG
jgi:hypothetical protein